MLERGKTGKMTNFLNNLSIKNKILFLGILIVFLSITPPLILAIINGTEMMQTIAVNEAKYVSYVLEIVLNQEKEKLKDSTELITKRNVPKKAIEEGNYAVLKNESLPKAKNNATDILLVVDVNGNVIANVNNPSRTGKIKSLDKFIKQSMSENKTFSAFEVLSKDDLIKESAALYNKVKMEKKSTKGSKPGFREKSFEEDALINLVINPIKSTDGSKVIGAVVAASILNRNYDLVDKAKSKAEGVAITIFKDDLRVSTNAKLPNGNRAVGTLLSEKVVDKVLIEGKEYIGRAMVVGKPYWSFYTPIKSSEDKIIGAFFAAMSEDFLMETAKGVIGPDVLITFVIILILIIFILVYTAKKISDPVVKLTDVGTQMADNDFTVKIQDNHSNDEIGELSKTFKKLSENLSKLISDISKAATNVFSSAHEVNSATEQTAQGAQQVATSIEQLANGANQIAHSVDQGVVNINTLNKVIHEVAEDANIVSQLGNETEINANEGRTYIENAITKVNNIKDVSAEVSAKISKLGTLSSEIEQIVVLIKGIAGQTNLLALNAAIEAARAGEHGKGFAVVAEEVKKLADQSATATDKINGMIKEIQQETSLAVNTMNIASGEVDQGVIVINDAGEKLVNIIEQIKAANNKIQEISGKIKDITHNSDDVVKMMENISTITEETAATAEEISSISQEQTASLEEINANSSLLTQIADELNKQVSVFKI
jgi:methyl-accepting chemotaxis protein